MTQGSRRNYIKYKQNHRMSPDLGVSKNRQNQKSKTKPDKF